MRAHDIPVAQGEEALQTVQANCVLPNQDAALSALYACYDPFRGGFWRQLGKPLEARHVHLAHRGLCTGPERRVARNRRANCSGMDARYTHARSFQLVFQAFRKPAHRKLAGAIRGFSWWRNDSENARKIDDVRARLPAQDGEESPYAIDHAPEIGSHHH